MERILSRPKSWPQWSIQVHWSPNEKCLKTIRKNAHHSVNTWGLLWGSAKHDPHKPAFLKRTRSSKHKNPYIPNHEDISATGPGHLHCTIPFIENLKLLKWSAAPTFEALFEMRLDPERIFGLRQNLQQLVIWQEEESREEQSLSLQIIV